MTFKLSTGDPLFNPREPVTINGYLFAPAPSNLTANMQHDAEGPGDRITPDKAAAMLRSGEHLWQSERNEIADIIAPDPAGTRANNRPPVGDTAPMRPGSRYVAPPRAAFAAGYPKGPCNVRAEGDEFVCAACARRWGRDEERPDCPNDKGTDNG